VFSLSELEERRAEACRLRPERALETLEEAEEFLRDRGLFTRTPDSALPSLFEACHEEPYKPGVGGFAEWPRTKWSWSFELLERPGVYEAKIHRGKTLYLSEATARLVDPIVRAELTRMEAADEGWARLLRHLGNAGPSSAEDLQIELELAPKELRSLRGPLERCGAIVRMPDGVARWDQVFPEPAPGPPDLGALVVAGVRAAVVTSEDLKINGPGADKLTVSGGNLSRVFTVEAGETMSISGLTIAGGNAGTGNGGGIDNFGTLTVSDSVFTGNSAFNGGGLANEGGGTATVSGSTFTGNSASNNDATIGTFDVPGDTFDRLLRHIR
jgi:hypothetical protein